MSLEAKAAILGAMYAVQQFFAQSGQAGTNLTNFNAMLGVSAQTLQQYQYAARQAGVSNEETANTFKNLQSVMTKQFMGKGAPAGWAMVGQLTGGFTERDVAEFMKNPDLLLQKLQQYAQKEKNVGIRNETLKTFGLGDTTIAALARNSFSQSALKRAPTYSEKEISALNRANIAWSNLGTKISMAVGHLNAAHGGKIVRAFTIIVDLGLKLADVLLKIIEKTKLFDGIAAVFDRIANAAAKIEFKNGAFPDFKNVPDNINQVITLIGQLGSVLADIAQKTQLIDRLLWIGKSIAEIAGQVIRLADAMKIFEGIVWAIDKVLKGWEIIFSGISALLASLETSFENKSAAAPGSDKKEASALGTITQGIGGTLKEIVQGMVMDAVSPSGPQLRLVPNLPDQQAIAPKVNPPQNVGGNQTINLNQNLNFQHEGKDAQRVGNDAGKAVQDAFRQMPAQIQGS